MSSQPSDVGKRSFEGHCWGYLEPRKLVVLGVLLRKDGNCNPPHLTVSSALCVFEVPCFLRTKWIMVLYDTLAHHRLSDSLISLLQPCFLPSSP